jgi:hypothetical protein
MKMLIANGVVIIAAVPARNFTIRPNFRPFPLSIGFNDISTPPVYSNNLIWTCKDGVTYLYTYGVWDLAQDEQQYQAYNYGAYNSVARPHGGWFFNPCTRPHLLSKVAIG